MAESGNEAREQRILDAAAGLIVHYGYDKTTVSDIARTAGVSKGTIYLHFESKDALFEALLLREMTTYADSWFERIDADPEGGTIAGMYKNSLYALSGSEFMSAMFRQDRRVFGSYLRKRDNIFRKMQVEQGTSPRYDFVKMMQDAGAMRQDLDAKVVAHIMDMLAYALVGMDVMKAEDAIPPIGDVIEGIATIMDRALTPDDGGDSEVGKAILKQVADAGRQQFEKARRPEEV